MKFRFIYLALFFSFSVLLTSCKDGGQYAPVKKQAQPSVAKHHQSHEVIVKDFKDAAGYTYVLVTEKNEDFWIAIPQTKVEVGETYYYIGGTKMVDFKSKELDKTFEVIYFVDALSTKDSLNKKSKEMEIISQPEGAIAVKNILEFPQSYKDKTVTVKGKVVKVNMNILDKNWVHITDGTSFENKQNLTFTTKETIKVGDIVTLKGVVTLDKDFGYGYVYPILIETSELVN